MGISSPILIGAISGTPGIHWNIAAENRNLFYLLGKGTFVISDEEQIEQVIANFRAWNKIPGNHSDILDDLDGIKDGKAAERIAKFVYWFSEAHEMRVGREATLDTAIKKYSAKWGKEI